jgi:hypothetical protein
MQQSTLIYQDMKHQPGPFQRFIKPAEMHRTFHGDTQNKQYKEVKMIAHVGKIVSSKSNTNNIHTKHNSSASTRNVKHLHGQSRQEAFAHNLQKPLQQCHDQE